MLSPVLVRSANAAARPPRSRCRGAVHLTLAVAVATAALHAAGLVYTVPQGWVAQPTASSMRVAQWRLPKVAGDAEDAELIVYFFGQGQGGSVGDNLERWLGQMEQPDGRPSKAVAKTETMTINGLKVTRLDVSGRYVAETAPGAGTHVDRPNYRLQAAVVETPGGPYFAKLTGPAQTVARWDGEFKAWVGSVGYR